MVGNVVRVGDSIVWVRGRVVYCAQQHYPMQMVGHYDRFIDSPSFANWPSDTIFHYSPQSIQFHYTIFINVPTTFPFMLVGILISDMVYSCIP